MVGPQSSKPEGPALSERDWDRVRGALDGHVHAAPSLAPRWGDDRMLARAALAAGMAGFVLKAHEGDSAARADLLRREFSGLAVVGGVVLNPPVGGLNPAAVETTLRLGGRVVWLPTMFSRAHVEHVGDSSGIPGTGRVPGRDPVALLDERGRLVPQMADILALIRQYDAVLATGHVGGAELEAAVDAALKAGVRVVVTHPEYHVPNLSAAAQRELAEAGVWLEKCYLTTFAGHGAGDVADMAARIRAIGPGRIVLVTDFGQAMRGSPVEGLAMFLRALAEAGVPEDWIRRMARDNPRELFRAAR
jgi:hypothetical protein